MWLRMVLAGGVGLGCAGVAAQSPVPVPTTPLAKFAAQSFHDKHYGVRFDVPVGWSFQRKDHQVSTFRLDARSASAKSEVRGVASIEFNPFPLSTFQGAMFYYSVERHLNDRECEGLATAHGAAPPETAAIGGADFAHGHDQHGTMCTEARDEIYTAFRKGSCYRFDLEVNTFCAETSGALEMTQRQMDDIERRMGQILGSVRLDWRPGGGAAEPPVVTPRRPLVPETPVGSKPVRTAAAL